MKKKILIFHPYLAPYRNDIYNKLTLDYDIEVLLTGSRSELSTLGYDLDFVNQQAKFKYTYYDKGFYLGRHLISHIYHKKIREFKPDIVVAHEYGVNTLMAIIAKKRYRFKLYVTCDDSLQMSLQYSTKRSRLRQFVVDHIDGMLVVSKRIKSHLENTFPNTKCKFIYFPIIQDDKILYKKINSASLIAKAYTEKYSLNGKTIFLYVGRLVDCKNVSLLIQAYAKVSKDTNVLVVVGDGELKSNLEKLVVNLALNDKVIFTGALKGPELYAWYYLANIHILPSKKEPFGAVVNEALVAGCLSIVSDQVGASSLIDNGKNGYIFQSNNANDLINKMEVAMNRIVAIKAHKDLMKTTFDEFYDTLISDFNK